MSLYAMVGAATGDLLSYKGRVILHHNRHEMEFLFPHVRVVTINGKLRQPTMRLADHPGIKAAGIRFPLRKEEFVDAAS